MRSAGKGSGLRSGGTEDAVGVVLGDEASSSLLWCIQVT